LPKYKVGRTPNKEFACSVTQGPKSLDEG